MQGLRLKLSPQVWSRGFILSGYMVINAFYWIQRLIFFSLPFRGTPAGRVCVGRWHQVMWLGGEKCSAAMQVAKHAKYESAGGINSDESFLSYILQVKKPKSHRVETPMILRAIPPRYQLGVFSAWATKVLGTYKAWRKHKIIMLENIAIENPTRQACYLPNFVQKRICPQRIWA